MTTPARAPKLPETAIQYLMLATNKERLKWGLRAVELGFPERRLNTDASFDALMPWRKIVAKEMRLEGLWAPAAVKVVPVPVEVTTLPVCPSTVRAVPNDILRSAIFAAIQGKDRRFLDMETIATVDGVTIKFTGKQLNQSDMDVWEQAIHLAKDHTIGNVCRFRANDFLKHIGRHNGKYEYEWLQESFERLIACFVKITTDTYIFCGNLISSCVKDVKTGDYKLTLNADTLSLYGINNWTGIEWEQRQALMRKPLAQWLHNYYASHAKPYPVKVETLRNLCGSEAKYLKHFREQLRVALDEVKACGAIVSWNIDPITDLVTVDRGASITDSQARHLLNKQKQPPKSNK